MILSIALLIGYLLTRQKGFYLAAQLIPISIFFSWSSMVNAQNSCSLPSSPLSTPTIYTVTVANCTTLVVRVYTNVTTSPKSLRFQVFTGGNYNNVTGVYCNLSNMNYTGSISGGYLYHNSNKTAIYGTNYYVLTLANPLPSGTTYVIARVGTTSNHSRYTARKSFYVTPTSIYSQPSNVSVCLGQVASFTVGANGMSLQYQWQIKSGSNWYNISGATSSTYSFTPGTTGTFYIRCKVEGKGTCYPRYTYQRTLTVLNSLSPPSYVSASDGTYCNRVYVTWGYVSGATSYTVRRNGSVVATVSGTSWSDYSASTSSTPYEVRANNSSCSSSYRSNNGYKGSPPIITSHPASKTICSGAPVASFTCNVSNGSGVWTFNGNSLGVTSNTLTINNPTQANQGTYVYQVSNSCGTVTSNSATLTIISTPDPSYTVAGLAKVGQTITLQPVSTGNHNWQATSPSGTVSNTTSASPTFLATERGTFEIIHSVGNLGCTASITTHLNIYPDYTNPRPVEMSRNVSYVADPVNSATGEFKYQHNLMEVSALNSELNLDIYYSSKHLNNQSMGYGWTHSWDTKLEKIHSPTGDMYIEFANGNRIYFTEYGGSSPKILPSYAGALDTLIKNGSGNYLLERQSGETYFFASDGKLLSVTDLNGNVFSLVYTGNNLASVTAPGGRVLNFNYNGSGKLLSVNNQLGHSVSFTYSNDNLIQVRNTRSNNFNYTYDANHRLLEIEDPRSIDFIKNTYDAQGRVTKQIMADGGEWNLSYDTPVLRATTVTNPLGNSRVYYYDANWNLIEEVDELGYSQQMKYNKNHLLAVYYNQKGDSIQLDYDSKGNLVNSLSSMGKQVQSSFTSLNRPSNIINNLGFTTGLSYDANGNLTTVNLPNTGQITLTRNSNGSISTVTDAEGRSLTYNYSLQGDITLINTTTGNISISYDAIGRVVSITDRNTRTTNYTYDNYGNILRITSPSGLYTEFAYDANGNLISVRDRAGLYTYYTYDNKDQVVSVTDPMSRTVSISRNLYDQITRIDYPGGGYIEYTYTARGNVATSTTINGTVTNTYSSRGLLTGTDFPNGYNLSYAYDKDGYLIAYSDNLGKVDSLIRDQLGRVYKTKNAAGTETTFTLNEMGKLTSVSHAGLANSTYNVNLNGEVLDITNPNTNTTTNGLDSMTGEVTSITDPLGNATNITYDNIGNPVTITFANGVVETRAYNLDNYLTSRSWTNGFYENYTLDANGAILSITTPDGTMSFAMNANYETTSISDQNGYTVNYSINDLGLPDTLDINGQTISKTYNSLGQEQTTQDADNDVYTTTQDAAGFPNQFDFPNGIKKHFEYRMDGFLASLVYEDNNGDTLFYQHFNRAVLGNVLDEFKPSAFIYSPSGTLSESYTYLANDAQSNGVYTSDALGRLLTFPDGLGSMVTATYDSKNRMVSMQIGSRAIQNVYDAGNFLVKQVDNGVTKHYIWNYAYALPRIVAEADSAGTLLASYVWANGLLVSRKDEMTGQKLFYLSDALGNVVALTDTNGVITDTYVYGNDGEDMQHTGSTQQPFTWRGAFGVLHQFGNIYYVRQRWHDASSGRFLSQDPYPWNPTNNQTMNRYVYGLNNPLVFVDVNGLYSEEVEEKVHSAAGVSIKELQYAANNPVNASIADYLRHQAIKISLLGGVLEYNYSFTKEEAGYYMLRQVNAMRHAVWQGLITMSRGKEVALEVGNVHESFPESEADLSQRVFYNIHDADRTVDFLNNQIGRNIASNYAASCSRCESRYIPLLILWEYYKEGLWVGNVVRNSKGDVIKVSIYQEKLPKEQLIRFFHSLDNKFKYVR
ncbi:DUF6531 domain-containing protein [Aureispira anguillae]|nr:DUF6531 domain-containing protein [Aureispira anguillae]